MILRINLAVRIRTFSNVRMVLVLFLSFSNVIMFLSYIEHQSTSNYNLKFLAIGQVGSSLVLVI